jgi:DNA helicase-2/ATP-dependent DNA helicase PcrA
MNLVRHELGCRRRAAFSAQGTCLAIYSAVVNTQADAREVLQASFPWCANGKDALKRLFRLYVEAKQAQQVLDYDDLLLYWAQMVGEPGSARDRRRFSHVLVDEYQDTNRLQAAILLAMKPDGRGLTVVGDDAQSIYAFPRRDGAQHPRFPGALRAAGAGGDARRNYRSTQPILAAANQVIALAAERFTKDLWSERASAQAPRLVSCATRPTRRSTSSTGARATRGRRPAQGSRRCCSAPRQHSVAPGARADPAQYSLRQVRRAQVPRSGARQGRARAAALGAEPARPHGRLPRHATGRRHRPENRRPGARPTSARRRRVAAARRAAGAGGGAAWLEFATLVEAAGGRPLRAWPAAFDRICGWYQAQIEPPA